ncbi:YajQ family cyclic di-GMP-binding protein [Dietzia sp. B32]|uniref:YajQ family cyclic di-GMP-binding protein n=1 Tax=Dietzia sp. B32 TaxID=2915130 RepID=UPI0021AD50F1|nr:YajQ family cyclic di-GMP-binding protein [Dietzia sp. B32]UVE96271.1 YajQ family cyclic di-GMP-binding protein [Dietzia sp. B32]
MASESSFDIVSEFDRQEVDNALNQAAKELGTRYDFRGTDASIEWKGEDAVEIVANSEDRVLAAKDVFVEKLVRRGLSMKALEVGEPMPSGKSFRLVGSLKQGIDKENAKKITKLLRDEGPKGVKAQIQGEEIRVSSKKRDDLQECISLLKGADFEVALQFTNYR